MTFWVYILKCSDGSYYTGHTDNLEHRILVHQAGELSDWTRARRPVELVYSEGFSTRDQALAAERRIKGWSRAKKEALIAGDWVELKRLSQSKRTGTSRETNTI